MSPSAHTLSGHCLSDLPLQKTNQGRAEPLPGVRTLSLRERSLVTEGHLERVPTPPPPAASRPAAAGLEAPARGSDRFDGKRSLATARMFLLDLCERLFARRDPVLAVRLRKRLAMLLPPETAGATG